MCGIAGLWNWNGEAIDTLGFDRFRDSLAHRGPDGAGTFVDPGVGLALGHRRLAILDLTEIGAQPMSYAGGRYSITFNGEIYNFLELRKELESAGRSFRTQTDTEVILASYAEWGAECQLRFNGMWAFAIWDRQERKLFLSRDRFGVKPLYYWSDGRRFAFASEMKAFLTLPGFFAKTDSALLAGAIENAVYIETQERCLILGMKRLLGGHCAVISESQVQVRKWWDTLEHLPQIPRRFEEQVEEFRRLFEDACRIRLRSDVPVASCLSGGLDSSSIVCTVAGRLNQWQTERDSRVLNQPYRVFVASFPGAPNDEQAHAALVAEHTGATPVYSKIDAHSAMAQLDSALWSCEDIFFNPPAAIWQIYRALREQGQYVTVDGHGADELLAGYPQHIIFAILARRGLLHPFDTRELLGILEGSYGKANQWSRAGELALMVRATPGLSHLDHGLRRTLGLRASRRASEEVSWLRRPGELSAPASPSDQFNQFEEALYVDYHRTILPTLLRIFDRASMAHGVEVRMPFLDWRLATFCFALPMKSKLGGGFTKRILRSAMKGVLPEAIRLRTDKVGFAAPMKEWFEGGLSQWVQKTIETPAFRECDLWDAPAITAFIKSRQSTQTWDYRAAERIWPYLNAAHWLAQVS